MRTVTQDMLPEELDVIAKLRSADDEATPLLYLEVVNLELHIIKSLYERDEIFRAKYRFEEMVRSNYGPIRAEHIISASAVLRRLTQALAIDD